jgi:FSR family fosmidomycin resistance protein-like MFS transporter
MEKPQQSMKLVLLVTLAHVALDFYMVTIPSLYAIFKDHFSLTIFQISLLPTFVTVFGSISQPLMGTFTDHRNRLAWAALGLLISGTFVSSIGFAPTIYTLAILLVGASLGSSLFHPTAGGLVTSLIPGRSNMTMAIFLTGGTTGMALAPLAGTQIVTRWGLESLWIIIPFCIPISAALFWLSRRHHTTFSSTHGKRFEWRSLRKPENRPLWTLYSISVLRSLIHTSFISFTALLGASWGWETTQFGWVLSGYLVFSTLGRIAGGYLADRVSATRLLAFSAASSGVFHIVFCLVSSDYGIGLFWAGGFLFDLGATTVIVLAQQVIPENTSTATGMMMGFSWGTAGLFIPLVGAYAEMTSVATALFVVSFFLFPAALLVLLLPGHFGARQGREPATAS